jgi:hypothetical protein
VPVPFDKRDSFESNNSDFNNQYLYNTAPKTPNFRNKAPQQLQLVNNLVINIQPPQKDILSTQIKAKKE